MALTINSFNSASGTGNPSGGTVTVTLPGTPQAGDRYVIAAVATATGTTLAFTSGSGSGWTTHLNDGSGTSKVLIASRAWQSGDPTTQTLENTGTGHKWLFVGAWLIRPGSGNTVGFVDHGFTGGGSSAATDTSTLGTAPESGDAVVGAHLNDDKQTTYSSWTHGAVAMTADAELDEGSGAPGNWSTAGFASVVTTGTSTSVNAAHDDTGVTFVMGAGFFQEVAGAVAHQRFRRTQLTTVRM